MSYLKKKDRESEAMDLEGRVASEEDGMDMLVCMHPCLMDRAAACLGQRLHFREPQWYSILGRPVVQHAGEPSGVARQG